LLINKIKDMREELKIQSLVLYRITKLIAATWKNGKQHSTVPKQIIVYKPRGRGLGWQ
jgi:hypothetical protein